MKKKRDRLQVIYDILDAIRQKNGRIKPTHILYKSNLSHQMMEEYLSELMQKEFIVEMKTENSRTYALTPKGFQFLEKYAFVKEFLVSFGLNDEV